MSDIHRDSDTEFLAQLQRLQPTSVQELCTATGVTANAVRQRLLRLLANGWITRETVKQDRGRPSHMYQLSAAGTRQLGDDYSEIASILWREVLRVEPLDVRKKLLERVKTALVERFGNTDRAQTLIERLEGLKSKLRKEGFDVELHQNDSQLPIIREHNCPYHELAVEDSSICELEQAVYSELLGADVELASCQLDGHNCCEFQVSVSD